MASKITPQPENKSIRIAYQDGDGKRVFNCSASWHSLGIGLNLEMLDFKYCIEHKTDIESAITDFLARLNASLSEDGYPTIKTDTKA